MYGFVLTGMHRVCFSCTQQQTLYSSLVVHRLIEKGYSTHTVWTPVRKFMHNNETIYSGANVSVWMQRFDRTLRDLQFGVITPGTNEL